MCNFFQILRLIIKVKIIRYEVHTLCVKSGFKIRKETLAKDMEQFLNKKVSEGFEVVNVSFKCYQSMELIALSR